MISVGGRTEIFSIIIKKKNSTIAGMICISKSSSNHKFEARSAKMTVAAPKSEAAIFIQKMVSSQQK